MHKENEKLRSDPNKILSGREKHVNQSINNGCN